MYKLNPDRVSPWREGNRHKVSSLAKNLFAIDSSWESEKLFFNRGTMGILNTLQGKPQDQENLHNTNWTPHLLFF